MKIPLGPSFETIIAKLLARKQELQQRLQEDVGPDERHDIEGLTEQDTMSTFDRAFITGAVILVVASLVLML